jgi:23S rRNA (adenine2503-C2)-methyltransferase
MGRLSGEGLPVTLSISLHAPNDQIRRQIMPIANTYAIDELMDAVRAYVRKTGRRVVFEYALIDQLNSRPEHARELARLVAGLQCHVNLIPLNHVDERSLRPASPEAVQLFLKTLEEKRVSATIRREMGSDIGGACGQLRRSVLEGKA